MRYKTSIGRAKSDGLKYLLKVNCPPKPTQFDCSHCVMSKSLIFWNSPIILQKFFSFSFVSSFIIGLSLPKPSNSFKRKHFSFFKSTSLFITFLTIDDCSLFFWSVIFKPLSNFLFFLERWSDSLKRFPYAWYISSTSLNESSWLFTIF